MRYHVTPLSPSFHWPYPSRSTTGGIAITLRMLSFRLSFSGLPIRALYPSLSLVVAFRHPFPSQLLPILCLSYWLSLPRLLGANSLRLPKLLRHLTPLDPFLYLGYSHVLAFRQVVTLRLVPSRQPFLTTAPPLSSSCKPHSLRPYSPAPTRAKGRHLLGGDRVKRLSKNDPEPAIYC